MNCPKCGTPGFYQGLSVVECANRQCGYGANRQEVASTVEYGIAPEEAQMLESRQYRVEHGNPVSTPLPEGIVRTKFVFNVPPPVVTVTSAIEEEIKAIEDLAAGLRNGKYHLRKWRITSSKEVDECDETTFKIQVFEMPK